MPEIRLIEAYQKIFKEGKMPKKIQVMYEENLQNLYMGMRRRDLVKYLRETRETLAQEVKDALKSQVKTYELVQSTYDEGCKSTGIANHLFRQQSAVHRATTSILPSVSLFEHHATALGEIWRKFPQMSTEERELAFQTAEHHTLALSSAARDSQFTQFISKIKDLTDGQDIKARLEQQRSFHFGHKADDQDENVAPFLESDLPKLKLLQGRAAELSSSSTPPRDWDATANYVWGGKAFVLLETHQIRPDSCITATNLAFRDYHLIVVPKSLMEKIPIISIHVANLSHIVALQARRKIYPLEQPGNHVTIEQTLAVLKQIYYNSRAERAPVIQELRSLSTDLHPVAKSLVNWNLFLLAKEHEVGPPYLNVWKEKNLIQRRWLNSSTYYRDVNIHDFCNTNGDKGMRALQYGKWPPWETWTEAKIQVWSEVSGYSADEIVQIGDAVKFWTDNVELKELQDKQGKILFREDVMWAKREARVKLLRDFDERYLRVTILDYQVCCEDLSQADEDFEENFKTDYALLSVKHNIEFQRGIIICGQVLKMLELLLLSMSRSKSSTS